MNVSVAMTTFNGEKFLTQQIESILNQDYQIYEIVICDDCSTDSTLDILKNFELKYPNLFHIYRNEKNLGYVKNFEKVLSLCSGDYIALSDQDDVWDTNKISSLIANIKNFDLIHSDARLIDSNDKLLVESFSKHLKKTVYNPSFLSICSTNPVTGCTVMIKKELLLKALPMPDFIVHDHWLAIIAKGNNGIAYYPKSLVSYRQHNNNAIGGSFIKVDLKQKKRSVDQIYTSRMNHYQRLLNVATDKISNNYLLEINKYQTYYSSYFNCYFRPSALVFYLSNLSLFTNKKNIFQILLNLFRAGTGENFTIFFSKNKR